MIKIEYQELSGKRTLLRGGVGSGKTLLLERILEGAIRAAGGVEITVIDMAPEERFVGGVKVGGKVKLRDAGKARYLSVHVRAPRVEGRDSEEVLRLAELNAEALTPLLERYIERPTPALFINDMSIWLHRGRLETLRGAILKAETFVGNAYWGGFFDDKGSGINDREREMLVRLMVLFDRVIDL